MHNGMIRTVAVALMAAATACGGDEEIRHTTQTEQNTQASRAGTEGTTGEMPGTISAGAVPASGATAGGSGGMPPDTRASAGGDVTLNQTDGMSDAAITGILVASNRAEVDQGEMAATRARNAEVKRFAQLMVQEHGRMLRDAGQPARGGEPSTEEANLRALHQETMTRLRNASGTAFDRAYMDAQVEAHQATLETLRLIQAEANASTLKDKVDKAIPVVQQHLQEAERLRRSLGA